jgi:hypothetical protein
VDSQGIKAIAVQAGGRPEQLLLEVSIPLLIGRGISVTGFVVNFYEARDPVSGKARTGDLLATGKWLIRVTTVAERTAVPALHASFENRAIMGRALIRIGGD